MDEETFWQLAFLAALNSGNPNSVAAMMADDALESYQARFGDE